MKVKYREFEIKVRREKSLGGYALVYFTVVRLADGWFMEDSFQDTDDSVKETW